MDIFLKAAAGTLIALILYLVLAKQGKDISSLLTVCVCCMITISAIRYLEPVIELIQNLRILGNLNTEMLSIILRAVGIGLLSEICCSVCKDAGNDTLGKALQLLASTVILWMSVPLFTGLIELVEEILVSV